MKLQPKSSIVKQNNTGIKFSSYLLCDQTYGAAKTNTPVRKDIPGFSCFILGSLVYISDQIIDQTHSWLIGFGLKTFAIILGAKWYFHILCQNRWLIKPVSSGKTRE